MKDMTIGILAGGKSSRMGENKALLPVNGTPMICRLVEELSKVGPVIVSAASPGLYENLGVPVVFDENKEYGPLEGARQIFRKAENEWVFLCAADMPYLTEGLVRYLAAFVSESHDCYIPLLDGIPQPLCGLYRREVLSDVEDLIKEGEHRIRTLFRRRPTRFIPLDHYRGSVDELLSINTKKEYEEVLRGEVPEKPSPFMEKIPAKIFCGKPSEDPGNGTFAESSHELLTVLKEHRLAIYTTRPRVKETDCAPTLQEKADCVPTLLEEVICTPTFLEELVVGRLFSKNLLPDINDLPFIAIQKETPDTTCATVYLKEPTEGPETPSGATNLPATDSCRKEKAFRELSLEEVEGAIECFAKDQPLHHATRGTHLYYLFYEGKLYFQGEDISRRCCLDKAIGSLLKYRLCPKSSMLFLSARIQKDMMKTVIDAGIPVLITKAMPTLEAVKMAEKAGITLIAGASKESFTLLCGELAQKSR